MNPKTKIKYNKTFKLKKITYVIGTPPSLKI